MVRWLLEIVLGLVAWVLMGCLTFYSIRRWQTPSYRQANGKLEYSDDGFFAFASFVLWPLAAPIGLVILAGKLGEMRRERLAEEAKQKRIEMAEAERILKQEGLL